jgi:hypothetical protein
MPDMSSQKEREQFQRQGGSCRLLPWWAAAWRCCLGCQPIQRALRSCVRILLAPVGEHTTSCLARGQPPGVEAPSAPHTANALVQPMQPRAARLQRVRLTMTTSAPREGADGTPRGRGSVSRPQAKSAEAMLQTITAMSSDLQAICANLPISPRRIRRGKADNPAQENFDPVKTILCLDSASLGPHNRKLNQPPQLAPGNERRVTSKGHQGV